MNLQEFAALKVGDQVENASVSHGVGTIVETTDAGVRVVWGVVHGNATRFFYSVNSTAWMHWNKVDNSLTAPETMGDEPLPWGDME